MESEKVFLLNVNFSSDIIFFLKPVRFHELWMTRPIGHTEKLFSSRIVADDVQRPVVSQNLIYEVLRSFIYEAFRIVVNDIQRSVVSQNLVRWGILRLCGLSLSSMRRYAILRSCMMHSGKWCPRDEMLKYPLELILKLPDSGKAAPPGKASHSSLCPQSCSCTPNKSIIPMYTW